MKQASNKRFAEVLNAIKLLTTKINKSMINPSASVANEQYSFLAISMGYSTLNR